VTGRVPVLRGDYEGPGVVVEEGVEFWEDGGAAGVGESAG
jgi:hypothetical protein